MSQATGTLIAAKTDFQWKIEDFSSKTNTEVGTALYSRYFDTLLPNNLCIKWRLKLFPSGEEEATKDYIGLHLLCYGDAKVTVVYTLSAFDEYTKTVLEKKYRTESEFKGSGTGWGYRKFLETKYVVSQGQSLLTNDTLTISCQIYVPGTLDSENCGDETAIVNIYNEELLSSGKFSDVSVVIGRKKIQLHKNILSSMSPVFQAMFDHEMRENIENKVKITDIKYDIAMEMFRYIYCRKVNNIETIADDLLIAADKYSLTGLKNLCEKSILQNLNVDNASKCLMLVTTYEIPHLKTKVIEFVLEHLQEIIDKPEYKRLNMECKDIIIRALAQERNK